MQNIDLTNLTPDIRRLYDIKDVLMDQEWLKNTPDFEVYYIYRGVKKQDGLSYDITIIPGQMFGKEFTKTKGHDHIGNFAETYEVLEGRAIWLLQKRSGDSVSDIFAVEAQKGQAVVIPPGYGHAAINPSEKELKIANWRSEKCIGDYGFFEKMQGACYYYTKDGWIKNEKYQNVPELRFEKPINGFPPNLEFLK